MKYTKTEAGQQAFKARSALLSSRQRSAFILFDGVKSETQVLTMTAGLGITQDDIDHLVRQGFLANLPEPVSDPVAVAVPDQAAVDQPSTRSPQERYMAAMPIATRLTAGLGLRGFRLNLAVEAANGVDGLLALLPKIQAAVGVEPCVALERALKD
ncbi:MAG: hypothetical protein PHS32_08970 [Rhodoferax sp.]|uniref:hypothetical protein n=1 Tax=Rhodoferax sp. TaxID=50421 RepID=UPI00262E7AB7|nr:hypothetical protein [Rhodoferax sp.]MDD5333867.1 hypothetical protein [Rhodoferax sp.]